MCSLCSCKSAQTFSTFSKTSLGLLCIRGIVVVHLAYIAVFLCGVRWRHNRARNSEPNFFYQTAACATSSRARGTVAWQQPQQYRLLPTSRHYRQPFCHVIMMTSNGLVHRHHVTQSFYTFDFVTKKLNELATKRSFVFVERVEFDCVAMWTCAPLCRMYFPLCGRSIN